MAYQIQTELHPDYLSFRWEGAATPTEIEDAWKQVAMACKHHRIWKALVETNYHSYLSTSQVYNIAAHFYELGFDHRFKVAHVFDNHSPEELRLLGEDVAVNRGAHAKVFQDSKTAKAWLLDPHT